MQFTKFVVKVNIDIFHDPREKGCMARDDGYTRYTVRIPTPLYKRVKEAAGEKSVNAEIVEALEAAYPAPKPEDDVFFARLMINMLKDQLAQSGWSEKGLGEFKEISDKILDEFKNDPELKGDKGAVTERKLNYLISLAKTPSEK